jgi:hypothetical protein
MYRTISNEIIRTFQPCYNHSKLITNETEELTVTEWIKKYRDVVPAKDIIWLLLRKEFLSEKDLRLFAVWCAREALKLAENPDKIIVNACNVVEKFANGEATKEELDEATTVAYAYTVFASIAYASYAVASAASIDAVRAAHDASSYAVRAAAIYADNVAYNDAAIYAAQLEQLLTYF